MIYARAFYTEKDFSEDLENGKALYAWVISAGPDKTIETEPTDSDLQGDDIGVSISTPKSVAGISDNKTSNLQSTKAPNAPPDVSEAP